MAPSWERVKRDGYLPISTAYTNVVNQRLALPVTYLAWRLGLSPNALTVLSALCTAAAGALIVVARPHTLAVALSAYLLLNLGYVLDSSDGQLARVAGLGSRFGAWLDHLLDGAKIVGLNLCFGWCLSDGAAGRAEPGLAYLAMALNVFFQALLFFGWNLKVAHFGAKLSAQLGTSRGRVRLLSLPFQLVDWGLFILLTLLLAWPARFFEAYLAYGIACAAIASAYLGYSALQMRRADRLRQQ